ncbi:transposase [Egibacter rhizosphaerae]|nr:transposase [Egibacter rhizosphaerae]
MAAPRKYPEELKARAVRMVRDIDERGAIKRVADQLDINPETLRNWTRQAEIDDGERAGISSAEHEENKRLRAENAELRRAKEILRKASAYFAPTPTSSPACSPRLRRRSPTASSPPTLRRRTTRPPSSTTATTTRRAMPRERERM